jgi:acid phosphatase (class A)
MRIGGIAALAAGCAALAVGWSAGAADPPGYLAPRERPDAARLLGPPPAEGSGTLAGDVATFAATRKLEGGPRWSLAQRDAGFGGGAILSAFSCALGVTLTPRNAPVLARMLDRLSVDTEGTGGAAKGVYRRSRPFVAHAGDLCVPREAWLAQSYSYPSGHASFSWASGLVAAEIAPDRAGALMARARAYGESRVVCGVHYASDVQAGRAVGSMVFAALQDKPAFKADLRAAHAELARLRAAPPAAPDAGQCRIEADAEAAPVW